MSEVYLTEIDPNGLTESGANLVYPGILDGVTRLYGHMRYNDVMVNNMTTLLANNFVSQTTADATFAKADFAFATNKANTLKILVDFIKFNWFHTNVNLIYCLKTIGGTAYLFHFFYMGNRGTPLATQNWTPEVLNPFMWCTANQLVVMDGSNRVSEWRSLVNTAYNVFCNNATGTTQPTYTAKDVTAGIRLKFNPSKMWSTLESNGAITPKIIVPLTVSYAGTDAASVQEWVYDGYWSATLGDDTTNRVGKYDTDYYTAGATGNPTLAGYTNADYVTKYEANCLKSGTGSKIYIDALSVKTSTANNSATAGFGGGVRIGSRYSPTDPAAYSGWMHEFFIFPTMLSATEVASLFAYYERKWFT